MKILLLDIETSPNTAFVWGIWNETIPLARLIESSGVLCWSAKWYEDDKIMFDSIHKSSKKLMLKRIYSLINEADAVVTYNGNRFDLPILNKEFILHGMTPPAPYKSLDLYQTVKRKFRFVSNKLDFIADQLGFGKKKETDFKLWVDCMNKDSTAWEKMEDYNKHDVVLLEKVYGKLIPWIKSTANQGLYRENGLVCPSCGSNSYQRRGLAHTSMRTYQRYVCKSCGAWFRSDKSEPNSSRKFAQL